MAKIGNPTKGPLDRQRVGERVTIFRRGEWWYGEYTANKQQYRVSLDTRNVKRARREAIRIEAGLLDGTYRAPEKTPLLAEVAKDYLAYLKVEDRSAATLKRYTPELERIVQFAIKMGATRISDYNVKVFDAYRASRVADKAEQATLYHESTLIKQLFNFAVLRDLMTSNPLKKVKLKKPSKTDQPVFTLAEVDRILAHSSCTWRPVYEFLACTGLRIGELCWLTWDDIDLENGFVLVRAKESWRPKDRDDQNSDQ